MSNQQVILLAITDQSAAPTAGQCNCGSDCTCGPDCRCGQAALCAPACVCN